MSSELGRFAIGQGRERPPYKPLSLKCPKCGGGLEVKDERAELVVCPYCSSHVDASEPVLKVLGAGARARVEFPLAIGASFRWKGARYEVIARMAFIEDGDMRELTRQYYLYNPRLGTLWLDEYRGQWSLSHGVHVMPRSEPFALGPGAVLETHDGRSGVAEETGEYELIDVDGSLPWLARVGDRSRYAEFSERGDTGLQYSVQRSGSEIEYDSGQALTGDELRRATGKPELKSARPPASAARKRAFYLSALKAAGLALAVNLALAFVACGKGRTVLEQSFAPQELTSETLSTPFAVSSSRPVLKVKASAPELSPAWMALDYAIVTDDDQVVHVSDGDISYYHGVEGGESWSEGSRSETNYVRLDGPGSYRLLVHAVSGHGEAESAERAQHSVRLKVVEGAWMPHYFIAAAVISGLVLVLAGVKYGRFRGWIEEDD